MVEIAEHVRRVLPVAMTGRVRRLVGLSASVAGLPAPIGAICEIHRDPGPPLMAEVVAFDSEGTVVLPYGDLRGVRLGNPVTLRQSVPLIRVGRELLGRVVDGCGHVLDGRPAPALPHRVPLYGEPLAAMSRPPITEPLVTGVRAIDGVLTCGRGQRLGLFAGSGVGKSTLLGQLARSSSADVNVIVLVGERGREVREFLERDLGSEGLRRSVVVVATGDEPAMMRQRAAHLGTAVSSYFRDRGCDVLLLMDSVTRFAAAQREIGLAVGEPPATRGYPPSVFAALPRLLERSGRTRTGSITGIFTVLVEGDDLNEPIADAIRGTLDGHVTLSRALAERSHWPAIDILSSVSRSMPDVCSQQQLRAVRRLRQLLAAYRQSEDLIRIGAYEPGSDADVDAALACLDEMNQFLQQECDERTPASETCERLLRLVSPAGTSPETAASAQTGSGQL